MNKKKLIIGIAAGCLALLAFVAGLASVFVIIGIINDDEKPTTPETTVGTTAQAVNAVPDTTGAEETTEPPQPGELAEILTGAGYDFKDLADTRQLIVVTGDYGNYKIKCYDKSSGVWQDNDITSTAFVGKNGTASPDQKTEGDCRTPQGLYDLGFAFGTKENPGTAMEYRDVSEGVYWVDDPTSDFYNKWVDADEKDVKWDSAEKMWTYDEYRYGVVVEYNTDPIVKGKGSAIFLHVGYRYTAGCIASDEATITSILKWLKPSENPVILIY